MRLLKLTDEVLYPQGVICCGCGCVSRLGVLCRECSL